VFFHARYKNDTSPLNSSPLPIIEQLAFSFVDKYLVFPLMGMPWCIATGTQGKNTHAEVVSAIVFTNNDPADNAFHSITFKALAWCLFVMIKNFQCGLPFRMCS
jgi:hypothetical protein